MASIERNRTIDVVRIIASFFVLVCHVHFPDPYIIGSMAIGRFAVPFFYLLSGWFLFESNESTEVSDKRIKKALFRTCRLIVISALLYFISNTITCVLLGLSAFYWISSVFNLNALMELLIFNHAEFICPIMWYLFAYVYVLIILLIANRIRLINKIYFLIPALLVANLIIADTLPLKWYHLGNWLFTALPFVLMGMYLRNKRKTFCNLSNLIFSLSVILGVVLTLAECAFFNEHIVYIGTIPLAFGVFGFAMKNSSIKWSDTLAEFGRLCTPIIFVIHCSIRNIVYVTFGPGSGVISYIMPFIVYAIAGLLSVLIVIIKRKLSKTIVKVAQ